MRFPDRGRGVAAACRPFKPVGGGSNPSGPMAPGSVGERPPYERTTRGSTPPAPTNGRSQTEAACSSTGEHPADNRAAEVRLLPGRLAPPIGTEVLAAERPALNRFGEGSSPSGPTPMQALVVQRRRLRPRKAGTWVRVPPGALGPLWQFGDGDRAHDVAVAYRLAMADVRVRLPLGTCRRTRGLGVWESLANPPASGAGERRFESGHPDCLTRRFRWSPCWYGRPAVNRENAGSIPAAGARRRGRASRPATAPGSNPGER